jgi:surface carbohydrate biosynthesis protein
MFEYTIPKKNKILIYGDQHLNEIKFLLKEKIFTILNFQKKNIYIICKMLRQCKYNRLDYLVLYIKHVNPKIFITAADNDFNIYKLKEKFPKIIFIVIQNGRRGGPIDIFNREFKNCKKKYHIDHFFVFGEALKIEYSKYVKAKYYCSGSIKNNYLNKVKNLCLKKKIVFISQYRESISENRIIYDNEIKLLSTLSKFAKKKGLWLDILPVYDPNNYLFLKEKEHLERYIDIARDKIILKKEFPYTYKILEKYSIIFGLESTLLYESLGRNLKICSFKRMKNFKSYNFNWPYKVTNKGFFYTDTVSEEELEKLYKNMKKITQLKWFKLIKSYQKNLMCHDYMNNKMKKIINNITSQV